MAQKKLAQTLEVKPDETSAPLAETVPEAPEHTSESATVAMAVSAIRTDGGTQARARLSKDTITQYAEAMRGGAEFPPPIVFHDGKAHWLADGFHRVHAHAEAGHKRIKCEVRKGTQRDAIFFSIGANTTHGLRRSNADKRRAVTLLLRDQEWSKMSDRAIGERCGVSNVFASKLRGEQLLTDNSSSATRIGKDGKARKASKRAVPAPSVPLTISLLPADEHAALAELESDIERRMNEWTWTPERFTSTLAAWAELARGHFSTKESARV